MKKEMIYAFVVVNCHGFIYGVYFNAQAALIASRAATEEHEIAFRVSQEPVIY